MGLKGIHCNAASHWQSLSDSITSSTYDSKSMQQRLRRLRENDEYMLCPVGFTEVTKPSEKAGYNGYKKSTHKGL